ncbi:thioesterase [Micromonospora tulbaghiae]|uniref:Thioesterase n=1 Tax=Micromonospora tulbaghiae TaxID=479978 RepID=A0A386WV66_9ACTN|nr:alpha/beta fold hydrolase [Micromonospora tulbaghiae]AYF31942.1 thioesterase [Micromonospora tulbaghiae]
MTADAAYVELWIRRFHRSADAAVRLIAFPHAGASASYFFPMSESLAPTIECGIVQYPARQDRRSDPPIDDLMALADLVTEAVRPLADRPLAFFGHSMGAALAFEVALRLEAGGVRPAMLFASGRRSPTRPQEENVHRLDDAGVVREMRRLSGTDSRFLDDEELLAMILPAVRSDYTAIERYRMLPESRISCPITVLTGDSDPRTSLADAEAWEEVTTGAFTQHVFRGGHFYLADHQSEVINTITDALLPLITGVRSSWRQR